MNFFSRQKYIFSRNTNYGLVAKKPPGVVVPIFVRNVYKQKKVVSRQPIFLNLKSNTMKNTVQI